MALFGRKKNTEEKAVAKPAVVKVAKTPKVAKAPKAEKKIRAKGAATLPAHKTFTNALIRPRTTEKAARLAEEQNIYTFEVAKLASKRDVALAIQEVYNLVPIRVAITNLPAKHRFIGGKLGTVGGLKKASVLLKKGDKIEFV